MTGHADPRLQPTLTDGRLLLRPLTAKDWPAFGQAAADPLIWADHPACNRHDPTVCRPYFEAQLASRAALAVIDRESGALIGSSRYARHDPVARVIEIGWTFLVRAHWGGGTNRALKRLMLAHAFTFVDRVQFWIADSNGRSQAAMARIGGVQRPGLRPHPLGQDDTPYRIYEIDRQAFALWPDAG